jgi:hypothetical protein
VPELSDSVVVFEYRWRSYPLSLGEARAIHESLNATHPELPRLIEAVGDSISGDEATIGLDGLAAHAVWDAMQPMARPNGTPSPPFEQLYDMLKAVLG